MLQTAKEAQTKNIVVTMTRKSEVFVSLDINVLPASTEVTHALAIKAVNKEVSIPGFRKGKAPNKVIEKEFPKAIEQEWLQITYNLAVQEAFHLMDTYPLRRDGIKCTSVTPPTKEKGAHFVIEFETYPIIPEIEHEKYDGEEIQPLGITENDIQSVIDNVRSYFANFEEITDRPAQENDFVDLDIEKLDPPTEMLCENHRFHLTPEQTANWMIRLIIGKKAGESVEGVSEKEEQETTAAFVPTRCKITINKIYKATLPELNDAFANKVGLPSVDAMKERIATDLTNRALNTALMKNREQLDEWLLKTYPITIPESMIVHEMTGRMNSSVARWQQSGMSEEYIKKELEERQPHFRDQAERSCRLYMLLSSFGKNQKIEVTPEEINSAVSKRLLEEFQTADSSISEEGLKTMVAQTALLNKTRDFIIGESLKRKQG